MVYKYLSLLHCIEKLRLVYKTFAENAQEVFLVCFSPLNVQDGNKITW